MGALEYTKMVGFTIMIAYIITDFSRENYKYLASSLELFFNVQFSPSVFIQHSAMFDSEVVDRDSLLADLAREPELGEVGCALAHRNIYSRMQEQNIRSALVLEDDAIVTDPRKLFERVQELEEFLNQGKPLVVHLAANYMTRNFFSRRTPIPKTWKPAVSPMGTGAYVINAEAAVIFQSLQTPIRYRADWPNPIRSVEIFLENEVFVTNDNTIPSLIDPVSNRVKNSLLRKVLVWTGLWYIANRRQFHSPKRFWNQVLGLRFFGHFYRVLSRLAPAKC